MTKLKTALSKLNADDDSMWTSNGRPTVAAVREAMSDDTITREQIDAEWGDANRDDLRTRTQSDPGQNNTRNADGNPVPVEEGVGSKSATGYATEQERQANADANTEQRADGDGPYEHGKYPGKEEIRRAERVGDTLRIAPDAEKNPPQVRGTVQAASSDRVVKEGDEVVVTTSTPINAVLENRAGVTRVNADGSINVLVKLDSGDFREIGGVKSGKQQDNSAYWQWPADENQV